MLGEGPRWDAEAGRLLWVDIEGGRLHAGDRTIEGGAKVCAVAPWAGDTVLVALADALAAVDVGDGSVRRLVEIPHGRPGMRCNDGACDTAGRFWIGTMALDESPGAGALYRYDPDGTLHTCWTGITLSNGLGWDAGGHLMYYVDSPDAADRRVRLRRGVGRARGPPAFAAYPGGRDPRRPRRRRRGRHLAGAPRRRGGAPVRRRTAASRGAWRCPSAKVTACCFAGHRLFVTAREGLYALDVPYSGPPARPFGGPLVSALSTAPSDADPTLAR